MKKIAILLMLFAVGCEKPQPTAPVYLLPTPVNPNPSNIEAKKIIVYDFGAVWCAPCRRFSPIFDSWSKKYSNSNITFIKIDIDKNQELKKLKSIKVVPTVIVEINGQDVERFEGIPTEDQVAKHLK